MCILSAAFILLGSQKSHAGGSNRTWDGSSSNNWNTSANWSGNTLPSANNDTAIFSGTFGSGGTVIDLGGNQNTGTLEITTTTAFSLNNNILTLATSDITRSATLGTSTINSGISLGANGGAWDISGSSSAGSLVVNGVVNDGASSFSLTKSGAGSLTLNNNNTFDGGLTVSAGILNLGNDGAAGSGTLSLNGGTVQSSGGSRSLANLVTITANSTIGGTSDLTFTGSVSENNSRTLTVNNTGITTFSGPTLTLAPNNATDSLTFNVAGSSGGVVVSSIVQNGTGSGADGLVKSGTGTMTLMNNNTFTGGLTLSAGTLILGNNGAAGTGTLSLDGGTIQGTGGTRTITNNLSIGGNLAFSGTEGLEFTDSFDQIANRIYTVDNTTTFSGVVSGGNNLTKSGTGTLVLSNANVLGTVTVNTGGSLRISNNTALGTTASGTTVNSGGALELSGNGTLVIGAEALTLDGTGVSNGGGLRNVAGNSSWAGLITINSATRINSDAGLLTLDVVSGNAITGSNDNLSFGGAGNITVADAIATGTGTLTKDGAGTLTLSGNNTFTGATTLSGGVTSVGSIGNGGVAGNLGQASITASNLVFDGGTLRYTGATASTNRNFTINSNRVATIDVSANTLTISGASTSTNGGLTKAGAGTLTLSGTNLHTGDTVVKAGTLKLDGTGGVASTRIIVGDSGSSGAILDVTTKTGGLLIASGKTASGVGTIKGNVTIQSGGFINPGNSGAGMLNAEGNINLQSGATLGINLDGVSVGSGYDQLNVTGGVTLAGMLAVNVGFVPTNGVLFFIVNNDATDAVTGTFSNASVNGATYALGGRDFQISYFGDSFTNSFTGGNDVVLMAVPEPAAALLGSLGILLILRRRRSA